MLLVLRPLALVDYAVVRSEFSFTVSLVIPPLAFVAIKLSAKVVTIAVATIVTPLTDIEIFVVVVAVPFALSQIHSPLSVILVVAMPINVATSEDSNSITNLKTIVKDLTFVIVPIAIQLPPPDVHGVVSLRLIVVLTNVSRHNLSLLLRLGLLILTSTIFDDVIINSLLMYLSCSSRLILPSYLCQVISLRRDTERPQVCAQGGGTLVGG